MFIKCIQIRAPSNPREQVVFTTTAHTADERIISKTIHGNIQNFLDSLPCPSSIGIHGRGNIISHSQLTDSHNTVLVLTAMSMKS